MIAIVILNYNGRTFLARFLPSVVAYSPNAAIYVADNASTDDSLAFLENNYAERVSIIRLAQNFGFAEGYNQALRAVEADYYLLLNSDVEVTENWLSPMLACLENDETVAAVQPKIIAEHARTSFEYAGASGGFIDYLGYPLCRGRVFDTVEQDLGQYDTEIECFWATGAAMLVRSRVFRELNGFDGDFFAHLEEIDWCWRAKRAGYKLKVVPKATVFHIGGGTLPKHNPKKNYLNFRNSLITLLKNEPLPKLAWLFPARLVLDGVAGVKFLVEGKPTDVVMIVLAHWFVFFNILSIWKKRQETARNIENARIASPNLKTGVLPVMSVWSYFIQQKKYFTDLI